MNASACQDMAALLVLSVEIIPTLPCGAGATCTACATDTFFTAGSDSCGVCPAGQAKVGSGCARCDPGFEPAPGGLSCIACRSGFCNPASGGNAQFDKCQRCDCGKKPDGGMTSCTDCSAGSYSTWTSSSVRVPADASIDAVKFFFIIVIQYIYLNLPFNCI